MTVLVGELPAPASEAPTFTPLVGAELTTAAGRVGDRCRSTPAFEYGVLAAQGAATVGGAAVERNSMSYLGAAGTRSRCREHPRGLRDGR